MSQRTTASDRSEARLAGLVAIVTGASSGIGQGVAERLALDGASVCTNYHAHSKPADELVDRIRSDGGSAIAVGADIAHEYDVISLFDQAIGAFGRVDILIVNSSRQLRRGRIHDRRFFAARRGTDALSSRYHIRRKWRRTKPDTWGIQCPGIIIFAI